MPDVVIAIGSNIRPEHHVPRAIKELKEMAPGLRQAPVYETPPIGRPEQATYWNTAVRFDTGLSSRGLKSVLGRIESRLGRRRTADRYAARTIDLDEIWRDGRIMDEAVHTRDFLQALLHDLGVRP